MELKIHLTSHAEVSAAHALLAAILGGAVALPGFTSELSPDTLTAPQQPTNLVPQAPLQDVYPAGLLPSEPSAAQVFASTQPIPQPEQSAQQVFAPQQQAPDAPPVHPSQFAGHIPAPAFAGVDQSMTAHVAQPGFGTPGMPVAPMAPAQAPAFAAPAPSVPVAPTPPASGVEVDKEGTPWDARIHTSNKAKTQQGVWKAKPGVDKAEAANIRAQLQAGMSGQAQPQPVVSYPAGAGAVATVITPGAIPQPPQQPQAQPAPTPGPVVNPTTFKDLMTRVTPLINAGKLHPNAVNDACVRTGQLASIVGLQQNEAWVPSVWALLVQANPQAFP